MRKKCVRRAKPVLLILTAIIGVSFEWSTGALSAQATDPLSLPRLAFADFSYVGAFRLPDTPAGGDSFSYGGTAMAYNPARNSLFINSLRNNVAEVTIPELVKANDVTRLPFASYLQPFSDPTEGHFHELATGEAFLGGLVVHGDRLYATGSVYYDASNTQRVSHFSHSTNLAQPSFIGMSQVWETAKTGYVAGYLANIPGEWQSSLGGAALTGQCCVPIVSRTSFGPAAFAFDPPSIGRQTAIPATPLLYYTETHATLGPWNGSNNERYNGTAKMGGAAVIAGTRTALFIGRIGLGTFCYGHGVSDPALAGKIAADGEINCYDPTNFHKGQHAYPYRYQIWAYDLGDFAAVKNGSKQPWDVVPYAIWPFELPTAMPSGTDIRIGGIAYDAQRQMLYLSQYQADKDGYGYRPIVHALKINLSGSAAPPAPVPQSTTVTLTPNVAAPQPPGASIGWSATATGGNAPYEYKWASYANGTWSMLRDWSTSQTFDWQPMAAASDARMAVWVRSAPSGSTTGDITADSIAATAEYPFPIADSTTPPPSALTGVTLTSNLAAPQPVSSNIVWTATPSGGGGALVYKWFISNNGGGAWTDMGPYASSNQFTWTPTAVNANYRIAVWVTHAGNTTGNPAAEAKTAAFAITASAPVSSVALPPAPVSGPSVTVSTPSVNPGGAISFAVANGPASRTDWVGLFDAAAPDGTYLHWIYLNGTRTVPASGTANATLQFVAPSTPGTYEVRLFADNGFSRLAKSGTVSVTVSPNLVNDGPSVTVSTPNVSPGGAIRFTVANGPAARADWVGLFDAAAPDRTYLNWIYLNGTRTAPASGMANASLQFVAPSTPGNYEVRYFADNGYTRLAKSSTVSVAAEPTLTIGDVSIAEGGSGTSMVTFTVTLSPVNSSQVVTVNYATADGTAAGGDYVATSGTLEFPASTSTRSFTVAIQGDATQETNEKFFVNLAGASNAVVGDAQATATIVNDDGPTVAVESETVSSADAIHFTVANGPANATDWVGLFDVSAPDNGYVQWVYLNGTRTPASGKADASLQFTAPSKTGAYEVRLFANNGYTRLATSGRITVLP